MLENMTSWLREEEEHKKVCILFVEVAWNGYSAETLTFW